MARKSPVALKAKLPDPAASIARRMAARLVWLADAIEARVKGYTALGSDAATNAARRRVEDAYAAAWPFLSGAATQQEKTRLVRQAILLSGEGELLGTIGNVVRVTIRSVAQDSPELGERMKAHAELVQAAIVACGNKPGRGAKASVSRDQAMRALLEALQLPASKSSWKRRDGSGRSWPGVERKRGARKSRK